MRRIVFSVLVSLSILGLTVLVPTEIARATFPGQNGRIAYVTVSGDHRVIMSVDASGQDPQLLVDLGEGRDAIDPAWSWDAEKLAFAGEMGEGRYAIFVANGDGSDPHPVTTPPASDLDPAWSPLADQIAFERVPPPDWPWPNGITQVHVLDLATGATTLLYEGLWVYGSVDPTWSPDGALVAFTPPYEIEPYRIGIVRVADHTLVEHLYPFLDDTLMYSGLDWLPNGRILTSVRDLDTDARGLEEIDPSTSLVYPLSASGSPRDPTGSPDGDWFAFVDSSPGAPSTLVASRRDGTATFTVPGPAESPAWGQLPGSAPAPSVQISGEAGLGWFGRTSELHILASGPSPISSLACSENGLPSVLQITQVRPEMWEGVLTPSVEGSSVPIVCTAIDAFGDQGTASRDIAVDLTPPVVASGPAFDPDAAAIGSSVQITIAADDPLSGLLDAQIVMTGPSGTQYLPTTLGSSGAFDTDVVAAETGVFSAAASVTDRADNSSASPTTTFVVYDPTDSVGGTGWVIPGGTTSESGDALPGLDGKSKASFAVSVKYKSGATVPTGFFSLSYGKWFKLQSQSLAWLVVPESGDALLQGTASIQGLTGTYPFRVTFWDGGGSGSDRLLLRVWAPGSAPGVSDPIYQASGDAGGQIQVFG